MNPIHPQASAQTKSALTGTTSPSGTTVDSSVEPIVVKAESGVSNVYPFELGRKLDASITTGISTERFYPQHFDDETTSGSSVAIVRKVHQLSLDAIASFGDGDLASVENYLTQISAHLLLVQPLAGFNKAFRGAAAFIRRAALTTGASNVDRPALNSLSQALSSLASNPTISLADASKLTLKLTEHGWVGNHVEVEKLVAALLSAEASDVETRKQSELFLKQPDASE